MEFRLSSKLTATFRNQLLTFHQNVYNISITLSRRQFENFHDAVCYHDILSPYVPLDNGMWLITRKPYRLHTSYNYIKFDGNSWNNYKKRVHPKIMSFLRHDRHHTGRQLHARYDGWHIRRSRFTPSFHTSEYALPRETKNVSYSPIQEEERSDISQRQNAGVRSTFSFRESLDVLLRNQQTKTNICEDGAYEDDIKEYGGVCKSQQND